MLWKNGSLPNTSLTSGHGSSASGIFPKHFSFFSLSDFFIFSAVGLSANITSILLISSLYLNLSLSYLKIHLLIFNLLFLKFSLAIMKQSLSFKIVETCFNFSTFYFVTRFESIRNTLVISHKSHDFLL